MNHNYFPRLKKYIKALLAAILLFFGVQNQSQAQVTSEGKLFYLGYMGMNLFSGGLDSQIIYITSKYNTKAYIDNPLRFGSLQTVTVQAGKVNRVNVLPNFYHPDTSSELTSTASSYCKMGLRIRADAPVYVYCMSLEQYRSAATYVLPYAAIPAAPEFYVMTHTPTTKNGANWVPSEFVIVGMDNNVEVEITPTFRSKMGKPAGTPFTITLKAGQNYQYQSSYTSATGGSTSDGTSANGDLTGTRIRVINGCGKINVFCGNSSAVVIDQSGGGGGCGVSQDHLFTQCIPTTLLGKNFTAIPYFGNSKGYTFKVLAIKNSTVVKVDGTTVATLNAGQRYYGNILSAVAKCITTSEPAMVAQFMKSEQCSGASDSDPDIVILPDNSQMLNYAIAGTATTSSMRKHYCNIMVKKTAKNSLFINGTKVNSTSFVDIACGNYSYYQATFANPSTNILESDSGFIAQSYGFGDKESYAFCAGALFENLDYDITIKRPNKCPGAKVDFTAVHTGKVKNYTWYFGDGSKDTGKTASHVYKKPGKYFVNLKLAISAACGQVDTVTRSKFIDIFPGPIIDFPDTTTLCGVKNVNITLDAGAGVKFLYTWQDGAKTQKYNVTAEGNYACTVLDTSTNCKVKDSTYVRKADAVIANVKIDTAKHCIADNKFVMTGNATFKNDQYESSKWEYFGKFNVRYYVSTDTLATKFDTTGVFNYRYFVTSRKGCKDTFDSTMTVVNAPSALMASDKQSWCQKEAATFYDSSLGDGIFGKSFWDYGDGNKATVTTGRMHTYKFTTYDTFKVQLITESTWGCRDTVDSMYIVRPLPLPKIQVTTAATCLKNNKFDFTDVGSIPQGTYKNYWRYNKTSSKWVTNILSVSYTDTGIKKITLIDTSNYGCIDSASATVHVSPMPKARIGITDSVSCFKQHFFDLADQSNFYSGKFGSRTWRFSDGSNATATTISKKKYLAYGVYDVWLSITSADGCKDSVKRNMEVFYSPQSPFNINDSVQCLQGNSFTFTPKITPPSGVTQTDKWDFGNSTTSTATTPSVSYVDTGKYLIKRWTTTNKGCKDSSMSLRTAVQFAPKVVFTPNTDSVCFDIQNFNFVNTTSFNGAVTYSWKHGDGNTSTTKDVLNKKYSAPGSYTVELKVTSSTGCADSAKKRVAIHPVPSFALNVNDSLQCLTGNSFIFTNGSNLNGSTINTWNWNVNFAANPPQNFSTFAIGNQSFSSIGSGYVTLDAITNKGCTAKTVRANFKILDTPTVFIDFPDECMLVPVAFKATILSDPATGTGTHQWNLADGYSSTLQNFSHPFNSSGAFKVNYSYTNSEGCKARGVDAVNIFAKPKADFDVEYLGSRAMETDYNFISKSTGVTSTDWLFGDNQTFTAPSFKTTFNDTGKMSARLIVANTDGCADTMLKMLYLKPELQMWIPGSFSPNNDQVNDNWGPSTTFGITKYQLKIYDRWGGLIYTTKDPAQGWNGKYFNTGKLLPEGVYSYLMSFRYIDGKLFVYKGSITVLK